MSIKKWDNGTSKWDDGVTFWDRVSGAVVTLFAYLPSGLMRRVRRTKV